MRPADVTDDDIEEWEQSRLQYILDNKDDCVREPPADVWYAGFWLDKQLKALNCTKELNEQIIFAAGQRQAYAKDYWQTVITALENYKKGIWETPGEQLAEKLMREHFGPNPDPEKMLSELLSEGVKPELLLELALFQSLKKVKIVRRKKDDSKTTNSGT